MTEIDLPSFLPSITPLRRRRVGSQPQSLTRRQRPHSHYGLSSSLPQSCNRVRPRPPRNELNRKTESEGEGLRDSGRARAIRGARARATLDWKNWMWRRARPPAAGSCSCYRWPGPAGRHPPPRARRILQDVPSAAIHRAAPSSSAQRSCRFKRFA